MAQKLSLHTQRERVMRMHSRSTRISLFQISNRDYSQPSLHPTVSPNGARRSDGEHIKSYRGPKRSKSQSLSYSKDLPANADSASVIPLEKLDSFRPACVCI